MQTDCRKFLHYIQFCPKNKKELQLFHDLFGPKSWHLRQCKQSDLCWMNGQSKRINDTQTWQFLRSMLLESVYDESLTDLIHSCLLFSVHPWRNSYLWAGGPSIIILIHKICIAFRGLGKFINVANEIKVNAAILLLKKSHLKISTINFIST